MSKKKSKTQKRRKQERKKKRRKSYRSDLTKKQWEILRDLMPQAKKGGRPRRHNLREIVNAILYLLKSGCSWRELPNDLPNWKTVYTYFRGWRISGLWERINNYLRKKVRKKAGRNQSPSASIIDSQSVKTTSTGGEEIGYDGGKKIKGRKRHILVDTLGLLLTVVVHSASIQDREGSILVFDKIKNLFSRLGVTWADSGYKGQLIPMVKGLYDRKVEVVTRDGKGFKIVKWRWIVERTFGWLVNYRRLSKDYERLPETSETMIYMAMTHIMLKRLG